MVNNDTDGNISVICRTSFIGDAARKRADMIAESLYRIDIKNRTYILDSNCKSFKTHACINILVDQICIVTVTVIVELRENNVPDFHVTVAFAAHYILRAIAELGSAIIIYFRAGTAGA